jgi:hypothetical protein
VTHDLDLPANGARQDRSAKLRHHHRSTPLYSVK